MCIRIRNASNAYKRYSYKTTLTKLKCRSDILPRELTAGYLLLLLGLYS